MPLKEQLSKAKIFNQDQENYSSCESEKDVDTDLLKSKNTRIYESHNLNCLSNIEAENINKDKDLLFYQKFISNKIWEIIDTNDNFLFLLNEPSLILEIKPFINNLASNKYIINLFLKKAIEIKDFFYKKNPTKIIEKFISKAKEVPSFFQKFVLEDNLICFFKNIISTKLTKTLIGKIGKFDRNQSKIIFENIKAHFEIVINNQSACLGLVSILYVFFYLRHYKKNLNRK